MSLQTRLQALTTAIALDIKAIKNTTTVLKGKTSFVETEQPDAAIAWHVNGSGGALLAKLATINQIVSAVIQNKSELWLRVKSRDNVQMANRLVLDSDGNSGYLQQPGVNPSQPGYSVGDQRKPHDTKTTIVLVNFSAYGSGFASGLRLWIGKPGNWVSCGYMQDGGYSNNDWHFFTFVVPPGFYYELDQSNTMPNNINITETYV